MLNYGWDSKSLLSLILVGLPELDERLALRRNRSLHSRLSYRLSIEPLAPDDTADYVRMRLAAVGCNKELFTSDAIAILHEAGAVASRFMDGNGLTDGNLIFAAAPGIADALLAATGFPPL